MPIKQKQGSRPLIAAGLLSLITVQGRPACSETLPDSAAVSADTAGEKNTFWSVGLAGEKFTFKAGDGYELLGSGAGVSLGYGYISGRWFLSGEGELIVGPFDPSYRRILNVDYQGTAFQAWWGYSAQELDLRHPDGGYGFIFGFNYKDIVGRSVDQEQQPESPLTVGAMQKTYNYTVRSTSFSITPGIFFCWMQPARRTGSESLMTRVEGYTLTLAYSMPLYARYSARFDQWQFKDPAQAPAGNDESISSDLTELKGGSKGGKLKGHSIIISFQALLGA